MCQEHVQDLLEGEQLADFININHQFSKFEKYVPMTFLLNFIIATSKESFQETASNWESF